MNDSTVKDHPDFSELLAARDGDNAELQAHLAHCPACTALFEEALALRDELRALPELAPPAGGWTQIAAQLSAQKKRSAMWRWTALAAAALLLIITTLSLQRRSGGDKAGPALAAATQHPGVGAIPGKTAADLPALISRSHALELALAAQPEPSALNGADAEKIFRYEDGLTVIDQRLATLSTGDPAAAKLWQKRTDLLGGLIAARAPRRGAPALVQL